MTSERKFVNGRLRKKAAPTCPCGKDNYDGKFAPFQDNHSCGYCHSCGLTFTETSENPVQQANLDAIKPKTIDWSVVKHTITINAYHTNLFKCFESIFGPKPTYDAFNQYYVGVEEDFSSVFWLIDENNNPRQPRVTHFTDNGKRDKRLGRTGSVPPAFTIERGYSPCLFGEHLLHYKPGASVALFESEKSALAASIMMPNLVCLAQGGASRVSLLENCSLIAGRLVYIFADADDAGREGARASHLHLSKRHCVAPVIDLFKNNDDGYDVFDFAYDYSFLKNAAPTYSLSKREELILSWMTSYFDNQ